jgi:predicted nucleotidyltransferase component of viral defense system
MTHILKDVYADSELAHCMGFKGGTALMLFHELPRFSVDLDFNLLQPEKGEAVYNKLRKIALKYGKIEDEALKFYGGIVVLDYGKEERKLKIEFSNRESNDRYDVKYLLGICLKVMSLSNMFSHKLCALLERREIVSRDVFDCWFLLNRQTPVIESIIEQRTGKSLSDYLQSCIEAIEQIPQKSLLNGLGELVNPELKTFIRNKLRSETIFLLNLFKELPLTTQ